LNKAFIIKVIKNYRDFFLGYGFLIIVNENGIMLPVTIATKMTFHPPSVESKRIHRFIYITPKKKVLDLESRV
tara:strand:- start:436 stop:654 length:219 start_codon:yes stop_codon:yes gene_type:complete